MSKGIKETKELVIALAVMTLAAASSTGKMSFATKLIGDTDTIFTGIAGAQEIPAELKDIDPAEVAEVYDAVSERTGHAVDPILKEAVDYSFAAVLSGAQAVKCWQRFIEARNAVPLPAESA